MGGPLYDWSRMELETVFDIHTEINGANADKLWDEANSRLASKSYSAQGIFNRFHVEYAAPCTALTGDLSPFEKNEVLAPSLRGDDLLCPDLTLIGKLEALTEMKISDLASFHASVSCRLDAFEKVGCCFSDHALDNELSYVPSDGNDHRRFSALLSGNTLSAKDQSALASCLAKN